MYILKYQQKVTVYYLAQTQIGYPIKGMVPSHQPQCSTSAVTDWVWMIAQEESLAKAQWPPHQATEFNKPNIKCHGLDRVKSQQISE